MDLESELEENKELYARFGLAVYLAQLTEYALITLMVASRLSQRGHLTRNEVNSVTQRASRKTLGILIRDLKRHIVVPVTLARDLYKAIELRNRLVHRYFRQREVEMVTPEGRGAMIEELKEWRDFLEDVNETLDKMTQDMMAEQGVTEEVIAAEMERLVEGA
jgi:hypothetical protein